MYEIMQKSPYRQVLSLFLSHEGGPVNSNMFWLTLFRLFLRLFTVCQRRVQGLPLTSIYRDIAQWGRFQYFCSVFEAFGPNTDPFLQYTARCTFNYEEIREKLPAGLTKYFFHLFVAEFMSVEISTVAELCTRFKLQCCASASHSGCAQKWTQLGATLERKLTKVFTGDEDSTEPEGAASVGWTNDELWNIQADSSETGERFDFRSVH